MLNTKYSEEVFGLLYGTYEEIREVYQPNFKLYKINSPTEINPQDTSWKTLHPREIPEAAQVDRQSTKAIDEAKANPEQKQSRDLVKHKINIII